MAAPELAGAIGELAGIRACLRPIGRPRCRLRSDRVLAQDRSRCMDRHVRKCSTSLLLSAAPVRILGASRLVCLVAQAACLIASVKTGEEGKVSTRGPAGSVPARGGRIPAIRKNVMSGGFELRTAGV